MIAMGARAWHKHLPNLRPIGRLGLRLIVHFPHLFPLLFFNGGSSSTDTSPSLFSEAEESEEEDEEEEEEEEEGPFSAVNLDLPHWSDTFLVFGKGFTPCQM